MADTTIGYAVLQIIPSLKGVSEAIEKQIAGQVVEVKIEPKTDAAKIDKSIKDAVKKSKPPEIQIETKIDTKKLEQELAAKKAKFEKDSKDMMAINKANEEKWAKIRIDEYNKRIAAEKAAAAAAKPAEIKIDTKKLEQAIGDAAKKARDSKLEMPQLDTRGMGTKLRDAITGGLRELNNNPALKDIQEQLGKQVGAAIGQKIGEALGNSPLGKAAQDIAAQVQPLADKFQTLRTNIEGSTTQMLTLTNNSGKIANGLGAISGAAGPLAGVFTALTTFMPGFNDSLTKIQAGKGGWKDWLEIALPLANTIERVERSVINIARNPLPRLDTSLGALNLPQYRGPDTAPPGGWGARGEPLPAAPRPRNLTDDVPTFSPPLSGPGRAGGGMISGPGNGTSDSILGFPAGVRVSNGEFVTNQRATERNLPLLQAVNSGAPLWDWIRQMPGFEGGGLVAGAQQLRQIIGERFGISNIGGYRPGGDGFDEHSTGRALDVMVGNDKAKGDAVKDFALANASAIDLKWAIWRQHLYYPGGGGYDMADRGNPTANHFDHVHIFSGPGIASGLLGALQGSTGKGDGSSTPAGLKDAGAAASAAAPGGVAPAAAAGAGGSSGGSGGFSIPTSFGGLSSLGLTGLGKGVGTTSSGSDLSLFGNAAASAVSGQVSSALGAFGVNGSPGWLQGISKFVGGISVGGSGGSGGATPASLVRPAALAPALTSGPAGMPSGVHSVGAGQAGGPQTIFNIQTARVEDAFSLAQRREKEKAAAKLEHF